MFSIPKWMFALVGATAVVALGACGEKAETHEGSAPSPESVASVSSAVTSPPTSWSWLPLDTVPIRGPNKGNESALAYDSDRKRTILFGGYTGGSELPTDTWEWNGDMWTKAPLTTAPTGRYGAAMTYDSARHRVILFGGFGPNYALSSDVWEYNGSSWVKGAAGQNGPSGRYGLSMTFDSDHKKVIVFGGQDAAGLSNETWEYDGAWKKMTPAHSPAGRTFAGLTYDSDRKVVVLNNGRGDSTDFVETWEYNGVDWTDKTAGANGSARSDFTLVYNPTKKRVVRLGGYGSAPADQFTVHEWNGTTWSASSVPNLPVAISADAVFDVARGAYVIRAKGEVYESTGGAWSLRNSAQYLQEFSSLVVSSGFALYAPDLGGYFACTVLSSGGPPFGYIWDGYLWTKKTFAQPAPRPSRLSTYDPVHKRVLVLDYSSATGSTSVWAWSGGEWTEYPGAVNGLLISDGSVVYDAARDRLIALATSNVGTFHFEHWEWSQATGWQQKTPATLPPVRYTAAAAYDPVRNKTVLIGGFNFVGGAAQQLSDTWEFDGTNWASIATATKPTLTTGSLTFDPSRQKLVLWSGDGKVWEYDGAWTGHPIRGSAPTDAQIFAAGNPLAFDGKRLVLLVPKGTGAFLWALVPNYAGACTSDADCADGLCNDGVCCVSKTCNSCETCNGTDVGRCTAVLSSTDPDSCTGAKSCSAKGVCLDALGTACTDSVACASSFCVDGVCCDSKCDGACEACTTEGKEEAARNGQCGAAKTGTPEPTCAKTDTTTCGLSGLCDGNRGCAFFVKDTVCSTSVTCVSEGIATGRVCDGLGACGANAQPIECGGYKCIEGTGCGTSCATEADCRDGYYCAASQCVPEGGKTCKDDFTVVAYDLSTEDCGNYKCRAGACRNPCSTIDDCRSGLVCDFDGHCSEAPPIVDNGNGCSAAPSRLMADPFKRSGTAFFALSALFLLRWRRRRGTY